MTDNYFMNFPARMQDGGRLFTDYKSNCVLNAFKQGKTSLEYRNMLTTNGEKYLNNFVSISEEMAGCGTCSQYSVFPSYMNLKCDNEQCIQSLSQDISGNKLPDFKGSLPEEVGGEGNTSALVGINIQNTIMHEREAKENYILNSLRKPDDSMASGQYNTQHGYSLIDPGNKGTQL